MSNRKNGVTKEENKQKSINTGQENYRDMNNHNEQDDLYEKMGDNPSGNRIQEDYQDKK